MKIKYKTIEHERTEDAPFVGAVISAVDCLERCPGCFNQHLLDAKTQEKGLHDIITEVTSNPLNRGIILAGLEWTLQPEQMFDLLFYSQQAGLRTMLYTSMTGNEFFRWFNSYRNLYRVHYDTAIIEFTNLDISLYLDYIKFGAYDETKRVDDYWSHGVKLASKNQYVWGVFDAEH